MSDGHKIDRVSGPAIVDYLVDVHHANVNVDAYSSAGESNMPQIMLSKTCAQTVVVLLRMIQAKTVVEIGTLAGFSAIRMASTLPADGKIFTLELSVEHAEIAKKNIAAAGLTDKIEVLVGDARELLKGLENKAPFDAVFIDADKESYDVYGEWAVKNVRQNGLVIGDNAYVFGKLMQESKDAVAMRKFHSVIAEHCHSVCLQTPEGMAVGLKK
eukprot:CAMPEP_0113846310 /NCGR_PEP_ID=MMETSP0372-20130328/1239_1 /TAXON_ID=340204 /ORGANISM="Lankesteria abbotti" /LENGTH=213 /DNA_ID=CAMNT_0000815445 /DNA_START=127 /DNA_END=768 /DNA_ORIENTATION=- /assembly_acc=CAM_ASM_000359